MMRPTEILKGSLYLAEHQVTGFAEKQYLARTLDELHWVAYVSEPWDREWQAIPPIRMLHEPWDHNARDVPISAEGIAQRLSETLRAGGTALVIDQGMSLQRGAVVCALTAIWLGHTPAFALRRVEHELGQTLANESFREYVLQDRGRTWRQKPTAATS